MDTTQNTPEYDEVQVFFSGGTSTFLFVGVDDSIQAAIADLADQYGWDHGEITDYRITSSHTEGA